MHVVLLAAYLYRGLSMLLSDQCTEVQIVELLHYECSCIQAFTIHLFDDIHR